MCFCFALRNLCDLCFDCVFILTIFIFSSSAFFTNRNNAKTLGVVILIIFSIDFGRFYMQTFMSLTLFIERNVDRHFFNRIIPTAMYQSIILFLLLCFHRCLPYFGCGLGKGKTNPSFTDKFALGIFVYRIGFLILSFKHYSC